MGSIPVANPSPPRKLRLSRRAVLITLVLGAGLAVIAVLIAFAWPAGSKVGDAAWVKAADLDTLPVNQPLLVPEQRVYLVKLSSGEVLALSRRSPYQGCTVPWQPDFTFAGRTGWFRDPCSGSTFDVAGDLVFGPAPRGMDRFPVRIDDGHVQVNIKQVNPGPPPGPNYRPCDFTDPRWIVDCQPPKR